MSENATFLVTDGTGSFGNAFKRNLLKRDIKSIKVFCRDEDHQYALIMKLSDDRVKFFLGEIIDIYPISLAVRNFDLVFHPSALKLVPPRKNILQNLSRLTLQVAVT